MQRNNFLESGDWLRDIVWDSTRVDPTLLESDEEDLHVEVETKRVGQAKAKLDMFNLSNDHLYEQERHAKYRIRQTFGSIEVYHAGPAKALQLPFVRDSGDDHTG
jgi:transcription initiation factor TFIID subunit 1